MTDRDSPPVRTTMEDKKDELTPRTRKRLTSQLTFPMYAASCFLRKRFSSAAELLKSADSWLHTTPSKDCDIVITFPPHTSEYTVMWILTRIRSQLPDIEVHLRKHNMTGVYGLYIIASWEGMFREAEVLRIRKRLKPEYGGGVKEFVCQNEYCYEGIEDREQFWSSQERQSIIHHLILNVRATANEELNNLKFVEGQAIIPRCLSEQIISQVFPLHNTDAIHQLRQTWVQAFFKFQPLDNICDYFGVKIAMYFAWIGHYTTALTFPALFGLFLWTFFYGNQATEDVCFVVFAFFNVIWTTLYLESWKRRQAELAYRWGTLDQDNELLKEPRPLFKGPYEISPVTGRLEPTYPIWKRNVFRYCVSLPTIIISLVLACITLFYIFELELWWNAKIESNEYPNWLSYVPKVFMAVIISFMDGIYHRIALWLNDMENYRLEEEYENHLTIKMGVFQFVSAFISLFYIAFLLQDMERLRYLLATLLITRQVVGNIKESVIPFVLGRFKLVYFHLQTLGGSSPATTPTAEHANGDGSREQAWRKKFRESKDRINISQAEQESNMFKYDGTFDDYLEMFIQFGYVMLFSSAFPMAAACAFLNNLIEIRSDAFKVSCSMQRPFSVRVANIGAWQIMMEIMGVMAIVVNCTLIGMSGPLHRLLPDLSTTGTIILIVILEHVLLAIKFALAYAITDVPDWVAAEMAKVEFKRREAYRAYDGLQTFQQNKGPWDNSAFESAKPASFAGDFEQSQPYHDNLPPEFLEQDPMFSKELLQSDNHNWNRDPAASATPPKPDIHNNEDSTPPWYNEDETPPPSASSTDDAEQPPAAEPTEVQAEPRHRHVSCPPSMVGNALTTTVARSTLAFLGLPKPKLPSALKQLSGKRSDFVSDREPCEESTDEDEPLLRKEGRRFSLFSSNKH